MAAVPPNGNVVSSQTRQQELAVPGDHQEGRLAAQQSAEAVQGHQHVSPDLVPPTLARSRNLSQDSSSIVYIIKTVCLPVEEERHLLSEMRQTPGLI